ncbi:magoh [Symbiodinium natans]|uniref:Magoh protein n=1 Tax=Symbiodinium natans TaxID=878477 RepID=A0A812UMW5_9DINO|nr:magoh [Symbiodinium natans]
MEHVKLPQCGDGTESPWPSHRFLQDTALKLASDSQRHELVCGSDRSPISAPTITPPKSRMSSTSQHREDERLMRSSFLAEASECIRALQAVFDNAHVSTFQSRFEDWRKVDLKATAQLQQHAKSLQRLNSSLEDFLARCSAVETFQEFHGTMATLSEAILGLKDFRESFTASIEQISDGIAERVLTSLRAFDEERHAWLHKTLETQSQVQESMSITQRKIWNRLETIGYSIDQQARTALAQKEQLARVDAVQSAIQQDCQCLVDLQQNVFKSFRNSSEQQESLQDNIFSKIGSGMENLETYMVNSLGWTAELPSLSAAFGGLEGRLTEWETKSQEMTDLRVELSRLEALLRETEGDLGRTRQEKLDGLSQQTVLNDQLQSLRETLQQTSTQLETAELASLLNSMKRIRDIETKGNIKLDRQFGRIVFLQQLAFLPSVPPKDAKQNPVTVALADPSQAESVLEDFADVVKMFQVPLNISISCKIPKGGDTAVWQDMATKRAQVLKDYLVNNGFPEDKVQTSGAVGINETSVLLLDSSIFPPKPPAKNARGASKSPR